MYLFDEFELKKDFRKHFDNVLSENTALKFILFEIFFKGTAYVIGGYIRDILNQKESRDVDIIVDLSHKDLDEIIRNSKSQFEVNRHKGYKIHFSQLDVDIWSIENNWAFKERLVKLNNDDKLGSIAKGCFYNYDSLVMNLHNYNYNISNYNNFIKNNKLDILQKVPAYKLLNPTTQANILRAFYLKEIFNCEYSSNTKSYLISKIGEIKDSGNDIYETLNNVLKKYPKYKNQLSANSIEQHVKDLFENNDIDNQLKLKI